MARASTFFETQERTAATTDLTAEHIHADANLPDEVADKMPGIVSEPCWALARPQEIDAVHLRAAKTFRPEASRSLGELLNDQGIVCEGNAKIRCQRINGPLQGQRNRCH